jgi:hypothetical protein
MNKGANKGPKPEMKLALRCPLCREGNLRPIGQRFQTGLSELRICDPRRRKITRTMTVEMTRPQRRFGDGTVLIHRDAKGPESSEVIN